MFQAPRAGYAEKSARWKAGKKACCLKGRLKIPWGGSWGGEGGRERIVWVWAKLDLRWARSWGQNRDREGFVVVPWSS